MTSSNQLDFHEPTLQQVADLCSQFGFTCAGEADLACLRAMLREGFSRYGHQPAPPAEGEVGELVDALRDAAFDLNGSDPAKSMLTRAADLLEQRHPAPVPVSERLPGPEDCDAEGLCWWLIEPYPRPVGPGGKLWSLSRYCPGSTYWLSATDLPLPAVEGA